MSVDPIRALVVLPNLAPGGAQLQGVLLAKELSDSGLEVGIFLTHSDETTRSNSSKLSGIRTISTSDYKAPQSVFEVLLEYLLSASDILRIQKVSNRLKALISMAIFARLGVDPSLARALRHNLKVAKAANGLRHFIQNERISVLISFLPQPNLVAVISSDESAKVIVVERNDFFAQPVGLGIRTAQLMTYHKAAIVAANSVTATSQLAQQFPNCRVAFLPNTLPNIRQQIGETTRSKRVLVAGRLEPQKRPLEVLEAFCTARKFASEWSIGFAGSGSLLQELEALAKNLGVTERVSVFGHLDAEDVPYWDAMVCVLNSDYEGSPNVLAEAICWGVIPLVRRSVLEASEFIPRDLETVLIFDDFPDLVRKLESLPMLAAKRSEIVSKLQSRYSATLRAYRSERNRLIETVIAMAQNQNSLPAGEYGGPQGSN